MWGGVILNTNTIDEFQVFTDSKELPKEYLILKLRMSFNKDLLEKKVISFDVYSRMQKLLIKKMDKIILENKKWHLSRKESKSGYN